MTQSSQMMQTSQTSQPQQQQPPVDKNPTDTFLQMARRLWSNTERIRAGFQEAFLSLDLKSRVSPALTPIPTSAQPPPCGSGTGSVSNVLLRQSADALRTEILLDVSRALREVFSSVEELRETAGQLRLADGLRRQLSYNAEEVLLRACDALERQAREGGAEVMDKLRGILRELNRLQSDISRAQERGSGSGVSGDGGAGDGAARSSPADLIRSAALTAARGLESLQLLSAAARGADVQQQLFALPAKIGGEWAEVQVKFVKDRRHRGMGGGGGHVSVYLNVAPSRLGEVSAHFDFHPPAGLKLSFQFERPEAAGWFRGESGALREALARAGLPGAALDFRVKRVAKTAISEADSRASTSAGAAVAAVKDGKVDFRI
jgi:hypothetical protein